MSATRIALGLAMTALFGPTSAPVHAGQAPGSAAVPDIAITARDRVYVAEQFSNTVSVIDPSSNRLLGVIRLGEPAPANFSPLYRGQVLVHGMGFSPDHRTIAVVSIGSNSVSFIDTATNSIKRTVYVGRSPHEAFFTPDGKEVWVTIRGEDYVAVLDATTYREIARIPTPNGPGMQIFSPDGKYGYICSSFAAETIVVAVATREVEGRVKQESPFCPNIAATPDGKQVWMTLKDVGRTMVFDAKPPFTVLGTLDTGPITNHVNFVTNRKGSFAYVTVGGLNLVKVFRQDNFALMATIPVGNLPHGVWPSGDGTRAYVGLENGDAVIAIDTISNAVVAHIPAGQAPQALVYVPNAVPEGNGLLGLQSLGVAGNATHLALVPANQPLSTSVEAAPTTVALFDQGLVQVVQAAVTGLVPGSPYVLALATQPDGGGERQALATFVTNPAGSAIVNAIGPIRQIVQPQTASQRRYLVITPPSVHKVEAAVQIQRQP